MRHIGMVRSLTGAAGLVLAVGGLWAQAPVPPAATVNGEPITMAEVDQIADKIIKQKFKVGPATELQRKQVRQEVLNMSVDDVLMHQFLRRSGTRGCGRSRMRLHETERALRRTLRRRARGP